MVTVVAELAVVVKFILFVTVACGAVLVETLVEVTVTDSGDAYWYRFKAKDTITIVSRTAAVALHLIGTTSFCEWVGTYIVLRLRTTPED